MRPSIEISTVTLLFVFLCAQSHAAPPNDALSAEDALAGWIALFDGHTTFGLRDAKLQITGDKSTLQGGTTTTEFANYELRINAVKDGEIVLSGERHPVRTGEQVLRSRGKTGSIALGDGLIVSSLVLKPIELKPLFNGRDLNGWDRRGRVPTAKSPGARWTVEEGKICVVGGPEALEYAPSEDRNLFGDFMVQLVVRTRRAGVNGGFFFRNEPGKTMMGYEAQLHNPWYDPASGKHGYTTGGIDDRQQARAPIAVDEVPFRMTVVAHGPHIATWVNGYQTVDWTDTRPADANPRRGLRVEPGTIQFQAHDPETDMEIHGIWIQELSEESQK